jgi:hypothetical protein
MTDVSEGMRTLRLQEPPSSLRFWTIMLGLALPAAIIVVSFGFAFATTKPTGPLLIAPIVALIACGVATLWILGMYTGASRCRSIATRSSSPAVS